MLEYVFKKSDLKKLVDESGDSPDDNIIIKLEFAGKAGAFTAQVIAYAESSDGKSASGASGLRISGCPRPPGCG